MQLNKVQSRFKDVMLDHPDVVANPPDDLSAVFESGNIPLSNRLKIYRNNIVGSVTDMMVATFPTLEKLVGKDFLEGMSRSFILENPPNNGCLNLYGSGFAEFIETFEPAKALPYLADVARLELAMNESYYAKDDDSLRAEALSDIALDELGNCVLALRDSVKLLKMHYPVTAIRDYAFSDQSSAPPDINRGSEYIMVHRPHLSCEIVTVTTAEFTMLLQCKKSVSIGDALAYVLNAYPDFDVQSFLQKFIFLETFMAFSSNVDT